MDRATTSPTSRPTCRRTTCRRRARRPRTRCAATRRSSCRPTASAGCTRRPASPTARCPRTTSRTSRPSRNPLHPQAQASPSRMQFDRDDNRYNPTAGDPGADVFPFALMTYRIAEHHTAGGMSRFLPYLSELAPDPFVEVSPELAAAARARARRVGDDRHHAHGDRGARAGHRPHARRRTIDGRTRAHRRRCRTTGARTASRRGDSANDLLPLVLDRNVQDLGVQGGDVRRPAGPAAARRRRCSAFVDAYRQAGRRGVSARASASSPTRRCASAARRARSPARSGTRSPRTGSTSSGCRWTTRARSARRPGATSPSSSSASRTRSTRCAG